MFRNIEDAPASVRSLLSVMVQRAGDGELSHICDDLLDSDIEIVSAEDVPALLESIRDWNVGGDPDSDEPWPEDMESIGSGSLVSFAAYLIQPDTPHESEGTQDD